MSAPRLRRNSLRIGHLVIGTALIAYIYTPAGDISGIQWAVRLVVLPGLVATGMLMWKLPGWRRQVQNRRTRRAAHA